jgi:hypothetical protein
MAVLAQRGLQRSPDEAGGAGQDDAHAPS